MSPMHPPRWRFYWLPDGCRFFVARPDEETPTWFVSLWLFAFEIPASAASIAVTERQDDERHRA